MSPLRRLQLAVELRHRIRDALPRQPDDVRHQRREGGEPRREGVLHLGARRVRVLLPLHLLLRTRDALALA